LTAVVAAALLTGCVGYVDHPGHARVYPESPPLVVEQDDYVYYPGYEVYYSSNRRQYIYRDGRSWVSRPTPPRVAVNVLVASPSVRLGFHDAPASHHATIVKQYPKHWTPPGGQPPHGPGGPDEGRKLDHDGRK
jgi:hypothetical protein